MGKNQYMLTVAAALALLLSPLVSLAQEKAKQAGTEPKKAKVKILQKEDGEYLMLDTTISIPAGVSTQEAVKSLTLDGTTLKSLGAKKVSAANLGDPSKVESIQVLASKPGDSTKSKLISILMADTLRSTFYHRLAGDSAREGIRKHIIIRSGKPFDLEHHNITFKRSGKLDPLLMGKVIFSSDSVFKMSLDSTFRHRIRVEKDDETGEVKICNLRMGGEVGVFDNGEFEVTKLNSGEGNRVIILRSIKKAEPNSFNKRKKEAEKKAESVSDLEVHFYPNPTSGSINLAFSVVQKADIKVRIVDSQGKTVFQDEKGMFQGRYNKEINLAKNGVGMYVVQLMVGKTVRAEKVLVQ